MKTRDSPTPLAQFLGISYINYLIEQHRPQPCCAMFSESRFPQFQMSTDKVASPIGKGPRAPSPALARVSVRLPRQDRRMDSALGQSIRLFIQPPASHSGFSQDFLPAPSASGSVSVKAFLRNGVAGLRGAVYGPSRELAPLTSSCGLWVPQWPGRLAPCPTAGPVLFPFAFLCYQRR